MTDHALKAAREIVGRFRTGLMFRKFYQVGMNDALERSVDGIAEIVSQAIQEATGPYRELAEDHAAQVRKVEDDKHALELALATERTRREEAIAALSELHAQVLGECPSLLNEDSGGDARLALRIEKILSEDPK